MYVCSTHQWCTYVWYCYIWVNRVRNETKQFLIAFSAEISETAAAVTKKQQLIFVRFLCNTWNRYVVCVKGGRACVRNRSTLMLFTSRKISLGNRIFMSIEFFSVPFFSFLWFWCFWRCCCCYYLFSRTNERMNELFMVKFLCTYRLSWPEFECVQFSHSFHFC